MVIAITPAKKNLEKFSELSLKILNGFERISEALKSLLWEKAKVHGLSPIQIQILLFIANHKSELSHVSQLAREFNLTKPTISDAVRALVEKGLVKKDPSAADSRSYTLILSGKGSRLIDSIAEYSIPLLTEVNKMDEIELRNLYKSITQLIYRLNHNGILEVQRICFDCKFYSQSNDFHYCQFFQTSLMENEIRLDCPEFEEKL